MRRNLHTFRPDSEEDQHLFSFNYNHGILSCFRREQIRVFVQVTNPHRAIQTREDTGSDPAGETARCPASGEGSRETNRA